MRVAGFACLYCTRNAAGAMGLRPISGWFYRVKHSLEAPGCPVRARSKRCLRSAFACFDSFIKYLCQHKDTHFQSRIMMKQLLPLTARKALYALTALLYMQCGIVSSVDDLEADASTFCQRSWLCANCKRSSVVRTTRCERCDQPRPSESEEASTLIDPIDTHMDRSDNYEINSTQSLYTPEHLSTNTSISFHRQEHGRMSSYRGYEQYSMRVNNTHSFYTPEHLSTNTSASFHRQEHGRMSSYRGYEQYSMRVNNTQSLYTPEHLSTNTPVALPEP